MTKYQFFTKLPQISHFRKNHNFSSIRNFSDQLLLPYEFYGRDMWEILFFIFASCERLKRCQRRCPCPHTMHCNNRIKLHSSLHIKLTFLWWEKIVQTCFNSPSWSIILKIWLCWFHWEVIVIKESQLGALCL